jgi:hypothetical protein
LITSEVRDYCTLTVIPMGWKHLFWEQIGVPPLLFTANNQIYFWH